MYNEADLATRRPSWHGKLSLALGLMGAAAQRAAAPAAPAPEHLHWSSTYDTFFPAAESHRWLNMGLSVYRQSWPGGCGLQATLAAWGAVRHPLVLRLVPPPVQPARLPGHHQRLGALGRSTRLSDLAAWARLAQNAVRVSFCAARTL